MEDAFYYIVWSIIVLPLTALCWKEVGWVGLHATTHAHTAAQRMAVGLTALYPHP
jgi:hypothetical protein